MKRILYLHAGAEMYGADRVLLELIKGLDKNQFELHVILPNQGELVNKLKEAGAKVKILGYPILRRKYFNLKGILEYVIAYRRYSKKIVKYVKIHKIDIIHNNTTAVLEGVYIKRKCQIPLIWHVHEIIIKPRIVLNFINMLMGRYSDKIVAVSQAVQTHILSSPFIYEQQVQVIYNGIDNQVFYPKNVAEVRERFSILENQKVIGMIGRVNAWKGQNDFLEAVIPILQNDRNIIAFLAGSAFEGEEWRVRELEKKIARLDVVSQIRRIDYYKETVDLYNLFDIFVLPSTNPDPLPTVVLEAMACGKSIVAYRHGGVCEMVDDNKNGKLVPVGQKQDLTQSILELLENEYEKNKFEKNSLERQRDYFSLSSYISNFSHLYQIM